MVKYVLTFLKNILSRNIVKILFVIATIVSFKYAGTIPNTKVSIKVLATLTDPSDTSSHLYLSKHIVNNEIKYEVSKFNDKTKLVDGNVTYSEYNDVNTLLWIAFGILVLVVVLSSLIPPDEEGWEIELALRRALDSTIYCEIEDGEFVYMSFGRLLCKSDRQIYNNHIQGINHLSDVWNCPKYQTKNKKRDSLLDKILE